MEMQRIKNIAGDHKKNTRWAQIPNDLVIGWRDRHTTLRIVGIGHKYIRTMDAKGVITNYLPSDISNVW